MPVKILSRVSNISFEDGQVTEDGRSRALNDHEKAKLDAFKRQFDQYTQKLHDQVCRLKV